MEINLSSNVIERMEEFDHLKFLRKLDLSSNKIRVINGIKGLTNLLSLNLAGNKIATLEPLLQLTPANYKLKQLDLSDNSLYNLAEIEILPK